MKDILNNVDVLKVPVAVDDQVIVMSHNMHSSILMQGKIAQIENTDIYIKLDKTDQIVRRNSNELVVITAQVNTNHKTYPELYI